MSNKLKSYQLQVKKGFTLIELLVTIGIFGIILAGSWVSYLNFQRTNSLDSFSTQILSTIYQAQNQAMSRMCTQNCDTAESGENFSIYFDSVENKIVLYRGIIYNPSDNYNINVNLPDNLSLDSNLPDNSTIVFEKVFGNVRNYDEQNKNFSLSELSSGETRNFTINKLGVIDVN